MCSICLSVIYFAMKCRLPGPAPGTVPEARRIRSGFPGSGEALAPPVKLSLGFDEQGAADRCLADRPEAEIVPGLAPGWPRKEVDRLYFSSSTIS